MPDKIVDELNAPCNEVLSKLSESIDLNRLFPSGFEYIYLERVDSTNKYAKEHSSEIENAVIVAGEQYLGVGKNGTKWIADKDGSLIFTLVFTTCLDINKAAILPLFIGAAIHEALKIRDINSKIKWPNDIYIGDKKLLGILCESIISSGKIKKLIIGVGINVNQTEDELVLEKAISLRSYTGKYFSRRELLNDILISVFKRGRDFEEIKEFSRTAVNDNLYLKNEYISIALDKIYRGRLIGINDKGEIIILTDDGIRAFSSGKILVK